VRTALRAALNKSQDCVLLKHKVNVKTLVRKLIERQSYIDEFMRIIVSVEFLFNEIDIYSHVYSKLRSCQ